MKMRAGLTAIALLVVAFLAFAGVIKDGSLQAVPGGTRITLQWESNDETSVAGYKIEREAGNSDSYIGLTDAPIPAKGNYQQYEYIDSNVFKVEDGVYRYRITPVDASGRAVGDPYYISATLTGVSSVRRTWGSIKAMFR